MAAESISPGMFQVVAGTAEATIRTSGMLTRDRYAYGQFLRIVIGSFCSAIRVRKFSRSTLWLRFAALWVALVFIGFVEGYVLLPFGLSAFLGAILLTAVVWRVAPKWLR